MALSVLLAKNAKQFEPEDPKVFVRSNLSQSVISYVDFIPGLVRLPNSGFLQANDMNEIEFSDFRVLMSTANNWLKGNIEWQAVCCETVTFMKKSADSFDLKNEDTCFYDFSVQNKYVLRGLRLWIQRRKHRIRSPDDSQIIDFVDFEPEKLCTETSKPEFEKKEVLFARINEAINLNVISGRIVNIDVVENEASLDWTYDAINTFSQKYGGKCVYIFRVFFELNTTCDGEIDAEDFEPALLAKGTFFKKGTFESSSDVTKRVQEFIATQPIKRIINIKTVWLTTDSKGRFDASAMTYTTPGDLMITTRVFYVKANDSKMEEGRRVTVNQFIPNNNKVSVSNMLKRINERCLNDFRSNEGRGLICGESQWLYSRKSSIEELQKEANKSVFVLRFELTTGYIYFVNRIWFDVGTHK